MASRTRRFLIGCGFGCGALVLLAVLGAVGFGVWLKRPGDLLEPDRLLGADTTGYAEWVLRLEDPGTEGFVEGLIARLQKLQANQGDELPGWLRAWMIQRQRDQTGRNVREVFPFVVAWTLRPSPQGAGAGLQLFTASVERLGNQLTLLDWFLGFLAGTSRDLDVHPHEGEKIYFATFPGGSGTFFLRDNHVFVTSDVETARIAVSRLVQAENGSREATALERRFAAIPANRPLRGAVDNGRGELFEIWKSIVPGSVGEVSRETWDRLEGLTLSGGLTSDGSLHLTVELLAPEAGWAREHAEAFAATLRAGFEATPLALETVAVAEAETVRIDVHAPQLVERLGRWLDENPRVRIEPDSVTID